MCVCVCVCVCVCARACVCACVLSVAAQSTNSQGDQKVSKPARYYKAQVAMEISGYFFSLYLKLMSGTHCGTASLPKLVGS